MVLPSATSRTSVASAIEVVKASRQCGKLKDSIATSGPYIDGYGRHSKAAVDSLV